MSARHTALMVSTFTIGGHWYYRQVEATWRTNELCQFHPPSTRTFRGHPDVLKYLVEEWGAAIDGHPANGITALMCAAACGHGKEEERGLLEGGKEGPVSGRD